MQRRRCGQQMGPCSRCVAGTDCNFFLLSVSNRPTKPIDRYACVCVCVYRAAAGDDAYNRAALRQLLQQRLAFLPYAPVEPVRRALLRSRNVVECCAELIIACCSIEISDSIRFDSMRCDWQVSALSGYGVTNVMRTAVRCFEERSMRFRYCRPDRSMMLSIDRIDSMMQYLLFITAFVVVVFFTM